jgi:transposase-like protein
MLAEFGERVGKALETLESGFDDATAVLALPEPYRKRLRTTNSVERSMRKFGGGNGSSASSPTSHRRNEYLGRC